MLLLNIINNLINQFIIISFKNSLTANLLLSNIYVIIDILNYNFKFDFIWIFERDFII